MSRENQERSPGYVYHTRLTLSQLQELLQDLRPEVVLSWDPSRLDFSGELREQGRAFNQQLEVRWRKESENLSVLVLSHEPVDRPGLQLVPGNWTTQRMRPPDDEASIPTLIDPSDKRYAPQFAQYPKIASDKGHIACQVYYRDGVAVFVSLREIRPLEAKP